MSQAVKEEKLIKKPIEKPGIIYYIVKQSFDFVSSLVFSIALIVPMTIIALLIIAVDFGSPFYIQERMGKGGKKIRVYKFRSMKKGADKLELSLTDEQREIYEREYKLMDDPRLLGYKEGKGARCFGALLRRTSLDELPQIFFNICIFGNMSVVGPRPILEDELIKEYTEEQRQLLLSAKPGLTGYWQAYARNNSTYQSGERQKMELYYIENRSLKFEIKILFKSITAVFNAEGAV